MAIIGSLLYIDPLSQTETSYNGKNFEVKTDKKSYIGSRISYKDIILHSFKLALATSDDELKNSVEFRMYEDAGLDLQKQYKISYIKKNLDFEESLLIEAVAIDTSKIRESLSNILNKKHHIDFLAIPFLSFSTLYTNKIIEPKNDLFIYIDENEAFLSFYKDGEYISSKSVIDLEEMSKKLDGVGVKISVAELSQHLSTKGLDATLYERGESTLFNELETIFSTIFSKINDAIVYNRSVFGFDGVARIFLSMPNGRIIGMKKFIQNFGFEDIEIKDFNLFKDKIEAGFFDRIVTSYIYDKYEEDDFTHNLSLYQRELAFYKRESGRTILAGLSILSIIIAYGGFVFYQNAELEKDKALVEQRHKSMKDNERRYKNNIKAVNEKLKVLSTKARQQEERLQNISLSLNKLETLVELKKDNSTFLLKVNTLLAKNSLATTKISLPSKDEMSIEIIAQRAQRNNIATFIEDLIQEGFISIKTDEIKSDKDVYISKIEIKK